VGGAPKLARSLAGAVVPTRGSNSCPSLGRVDYGSRYTGLADLQQCSGAHAATDAHRDNREI
jgi:hypothetical protein